MNNPVPFSEVRESSAQLEFQYRFYHYPTGKSGIKKVYTFSSLDFYKLLDYWNHDANWKYTSYFGE
jgi:hypothetical protein